MVRMWLVDPKMMCRQHLLGEHNELHMLVGHLNKERSISGYIKNNCIELKSLRKRHHELAREMVKRGYHHKSPLPSFDPSYLPLKEQIYTIDKEKALRDLVSRCEKCLKRFEKEVVKCLRL